MQVRQLIIVAGSDVQWELEGRKEAFYQLVVLVLGVEATQHDGTRPFLPKFTTFDPVEYMEKYY